MKSTNNSIFQKYYSPQKFIDRYTKDKKNAVDVIIPLIHTNELWKQNLLSIYREVPVNRLLIGDGGCIDNSLTIARKFPRVTVLDHRKYKSLGYSIRKLIEAVETSWFIYLHSDVYLPSGWFETMQEGRELYDWYECKQRITALVDYELNYEDSFRPYSGGQIGRKKAFAKVLPVIEDDYLYRNEDIVIQQLLEKQGFKYGRFEKGFYYHQVINKKSKWKRKIKEISLKISKSKEEEIRECVMQIRGIIKYLSPTPLLAKALVPNINRLFEINPEEINNLREWIRKTNSEWFPLLVQEVSYTSLVKKRRPLKERLHCVFLALRDLLLER